MGEILGESAARILSQSSGLAFRVMHDIGQNLRNNARSSDVPTVMLTRRSRGGATGLRTKTLR